MAEKVAIHPDWTEAERWAWGRFQAGEVAGCNKKLGRTVDPANSEGWDEGRTLRRLFLETIIEEPYRSAIRRKGITILARISH